LAAFCDNFCFAIYPILAWVAQKTLGHGVLLTCTIAGGILLYWMLFYFLENTAQLRSLLGSEAHDGLAVAGIFLTIYVAPICALLGLVGHMIGLTYKKRTCHV
jgi:hypothetical protein